MKKRILCAAVCLCLATVSIFPAAAEAEDCTCGTLPIVDVAGVNSSPLYDSDGVQVFPPAQDAIVSELKNLVVPLIKYIFTQNRSAFADSLCAAVNNLLMPIACNANGDSLQSLTIDKNPAPDPATHTSGNYYYFMYDWRLDPRDTADELHDYIEQVKAAAGHDSVVLAPQSFGNIVTLCLLREYGSEDIDSLVLRCPAFQGVGIADAVCTKDITFSSANVAGFVNDLLKTSGNEKLTVVLSLLQRSGALEPLFRLAEKVVDGLRDPVYDNSLKTIFGTMPGIWAMVSDECYTQAKELMFNGLQTRAFVAGIDDYHYNIQQQAKKLLSAAAAGGTKIAVLCKYGRFAIPLGENSSRNSDNMIDLVHASGGAVSAPVGKTLGSGYVQKVNCGHNHLSPDNAVDASTCMFPEYTWFFSDLGHNEYPDSTRKFVEFIAKSKSQPTVFTDAAYPQFN